jgi:hypothetical protein
MPHLSNPLRRTWLYWEKMWKSYHEICNCSTKFMHGISILFRHYIHSMAYCTVLCCVVLCCVVLCCVVLCCVVLCCVVLCCVQLLWTIKIHSISNEGPCNSHSMTFYGFSSATLELTLAYSSASSNIPLSKYNFHTCLLRKIRGDIFTSLESMSSQIQCQ